MEKDVEKLFKSLEDPVADKQFSQKVLRKMRLEEEPSFNLLDDFLSIRTWVMPVLLVCVLFFSTPQRQETLQVQVTSVNNDYYSYFEEENIDDSLNFIEDYETILN